MPSSPTGSPVRTERAPIRTERVPIRTEKVPIVTTRGSIDAAHLDGLPRGSCEPLACAPRDSVDPLAGSSFSMSALEHSQQAPPPSEPLVEAMLDLERLEMALVEERSRSAQLLEEKRAAEERMESAARDVTMLETMLQQVLAENEALSSQVSTLQAQLRGEQVAEHAEKATSNCKVADSGPPSPSPRSVEVDEPEGEPFRGRHGSVVSDAPPGSLAAHESLNGKL